MRSQGEWAEYAFDGVKEEIERRAGVQDVQPLNDAVCIASSAFDSGRDEILPALDAILSARTDERLKGLRDKIMDLKSHVSMEEVGLSWIPRGQHIVRDPRAQGSGGFQIPHHLRYQAWVMERMSYGVQAGELAKLTKRVVTYLKYTVSMKGNTVAKTDGTVFIGHGRSAAWRDLKDFLQDRLSLQWDEFNRETPARYATKERLEAMLDKASFAFLVMTAEDEQSDGSVQARANVIHEAGLFQGRLGFERAIILLEEGCSEFSNIVGLGQIRFPKGNIMAKSEEIRRVLEREKIL
jgi:predicted nucleotide-binding protein